jgi:hypothetical protein
MGFLAPELAVVARILLVVFGLPIFVLFASSSARSFVAGVRLDGGVLVHRGFFATTCIPVKLISGVVAKNHGFKTCPFAVCGDREYPLSALGTVIPTGQERLAAVIKAAVAEWVATSSADAGTVVTRRFLFGPWRRITDSPSLRGSKPIPNGG